MFARHRGNRRDLVTETNSRPEGEVLADISKQTLSSVASTKVVYESGLIKWAGVS